MPTGGDDDLSGDGSAEYVKLSGGDDQYAGSGQQDKVNGANGNDDINGAGGDDRLVGGFGDDKLSGGLGDDILSGGAGDDTLAGGLGNDKLKGGLGNDRLKGGDGNDEFVFTYLGGQDVIVDYEDGVDKIVLTGSGFGIDSITQTAKGALISFDGGTSVLLLGISSAVLDASDFKFSGGADSSFFP